MLKSLLLNNYSSSCRLLTQRFIRSSRGKVRVLPSQNSPHFDDFAKLDADQKDQLLRTSEEFEAIQELISKSRESPRMFDEISRNENQIRHWLKKKIIEKKYFKKPQEVNFLTYDAKEQIRFLHHKDPKEWDANKLSQSFPISQEGVMKLLSSKCKLRSIEEVQKHDRRVLKKWREKAGDCEVASRYLSAAKTRGVDVGDDGELVKLGGVDAKLGEPSMGKYLYKPTPKARGVFEEMAFQHLKLADGGSETGGDGVGEVSGGGGYGGGSGYGGEVNGGGYDDGGSGYDGGGRNRKDDKLMKAKNRNGGRNGLVNKNGGRWSNEGDDRAMLKKKYKKSRDG